MRTWNPQLAHGGVALSKAETLLVKANVAISAADHEMVEQLNAHQLASGKQLPGNGDIL
jgi:hypothetical protein